MFFKIIYIIPSNKHIYQTDIQVINFLNHLYFHSTFRTA